MTLPQDEFEGREALIKKRTRMEILDRAWKALLIIFVVFCLGVSAFNSIVSIDSRRKLLDCTTPGGKCYEISQSKTGQAIKQLIDAGQVREEVTRRIVILAITCTDRPGVNTIREIYVCVRTEMKERDE